MLLQYLERNDWQYRSMNHLMPCSQRGGNLRLLGYQNERRHTAEKVVRRMEKTKRE